MDQPGDFDFDERQPWRAPVDEPACDDGFGPVDHAPDINEHALCEAGSGSPEGPQTRRS